MIFNYRSCRVVAHEIGHMFGMCHCIYYNCRMNGMMTLEEGDRRPSDMCPVCIRKLQKTMNFDMKKRYQALMRFCANSKNPYFKKDEEFFKALLDAIEEKKPGKKN